MLATKKVGLITCDKGCRKRFKLPEQLHTKNAGIYKGQDVTARYFSCPHCGKEYAICYETAETLRLTAKYRAVQEKRRALDDPRGAEELIKREKKLMWQMREMQEKIKGYLQD